MAARPPFVAWLIPCVLLFPAAARSQSGAPLPGMMPPGSALPSEMEGCCSGFEVGQWVEYQVVSRANGEIWNLHFAAVGREGEALWLEMTAARPDGGWALMRMLVDQSEGAFEDRVQRLVVQLDGALPLELPVDVEQSPRPTFEAPAGSSVQFGSEQIRVRSRTIATRHYRRGEGDQAADVWLSEQIPLWGLVRYRAARVWFDLVAWGSGATSRLIGEPVPFDPRTIGQ